MVVIRSRVNCFRCGEAVDRTATLLLSSSFEKKYECYGCYKQNKTGMSTKVKQELFCGRCKYKFKSKGALCPYCNKDDLVMSPHFKIEDLL